MQSSDRVEKSTWYSSLPLMTLPDVGDVDWLGTASAVRCQLLQNSCWVKHGARQGADVAWAARPATATILSEPVNRPACFLCWL